MFKEQEVGGITTSGTTTVTISYGDPLLATQEMAEDWGWDLSRMHTNDRTGLLEWNTDEWAREQWRGDVDRSSWGSLRRDEEEFITCSYCGERKRRATYCKNLACAARQREDFKQFFPGE